MNKLSDQKEAIIDKMICLAYSIRVIAEVAQVSRNAVLARREPMVYGRGFWFTFCPCGKRVIDPDTDHFHGIEPCERRERRSRLLLRLVRKRRQPVAKPVVKLQANFDQYVPVDRPPIPTSKLELRDMLAQAARNTAKLPTE